MIVNDKARARVLNGADFDKNDVLEYTKKSENFFIIADNLKNLIAIADIDIENWHLKYFNVFK